MYGKNARRVSGSGCELPHESGTCKAYFARYYFNKDTKKCEMFIYRGCYVNENNFRTKEECQMTCMSEQRSDYPMLEMYGKKARRVSGSSCELRPYSGPIRCLASFRRYYFNKDTKKCEILFMEVVSLIEIISGQRKSVKRLV